MLGILREVMSAMDIGNAKRKRENCIPNAEVTRSTLEGEFIGTALRLASVHKSLTRQQSFK